MHFRQFAPNLVKSRAVTGWERMAVDTLSRYLFTCFASYGHFYVDFTWLQYFHFHIYLCSLRWFTMASSMETCNLSVRPTI